ncbi:MAG TPA: glycosyltransferase family 39 protein [Terriglobia bacterium]|nr:glycosyltransferase family 39 protein [Terriglobia bacterium]
MARRAAVIVVAAVIVFLAVVRLRVANIPLERDEGEYAYNGQLILDGVPPFSMAYNMKFPGVYYAYSAIMAVFGQTPWGIHTGVMIVNAAAILILFFLTQRLLRNSTAAVVAAVSYGFLSADRFIMGIFGHAAHFVALAALAGLLVLFRAIDSRRYSLFIVAGVLLGISVLMKQNGAFFLGLGGGLALWSGFKTGMRGLTAGIGRAALVGGGAAIPLGALVAVLRAQGVLEKFWFWTIAYASQYVSQVSLGEAWQLFWDTLGRITEATAPIWLLGLAGAILLWIAPWSWEVRGLLTAFFVVSAAAVCPGFFFRQHYFILLLPALSVFCGVAALSIERLIGARISADLGRAVAVGLVLMTIGVCAYREWDYFFAVPMRQLSREIYGDNPFVEAPEIAKYIQAHTTPDDRIAVLGSEPEIYFYAKRKSATGYIYMYPLMERQKYSGQMQDEMISEITAAHPKYIVYVNVATSWLARNSKERILTWSRAYLDACYQIVGVGDIVSADETHWAWDDQVRGFQPRSGAVIFTLVRKSDVPCAVS